MLNDNLNLIEPIILELVKFPIVIFGVLFFNIFFKNFLYGFFDGLLNDMRESGYSDMDPFSAEHDDPKYKHSQLLKKRINIIVNIISAISVIGLLLAIVIL